MLQYVMAKLNYMSALCMNESEHFCAERSVPMG